MKRCKPESETEKERTHTYTWGHRAWAGLELNKASHNQPYTRLGNRAWLSLDTHNIPQSLYPHQNSSHKVGTLSNPTPQ